MDPHTTAALVILTTASFDLPRAITMAMRNSLGHPPRSLVRPHHPAPVPGIRPSSVRFSTESHDTDHHHSEQAPIRRTTVPELGHANVYLASAKSHPLPAHPMECLTDLGVVPIPHVIHH